MKIRKGYEIKSVEGIHIVVPSEDNVSMAGVMTLNDTALYVWNLLKTDITRDEIVDKMASDYDAPREIISADVDELLASFKDNQLID